MTTTHLNITPLADHGDSRGSSFNLPDSVFRFIGQIDHAHLTTLLPNSIRGNHYHVRRKEFLVILYTDSWTFAWSESGKESIETQRFDGQGAVLIEIAPAIPHAVRNDGATALTILAFSDQKYEPAQVDTIRKILI